MRELALPGDRADPRDASRLSPYIFAAVAVGFALRAALALLAEHQLDCDESTVALMSLDILEQGARPMFFYGGSYNGGAAFEAYLGAVLVALFGFSAIGFKLLLALLWAAGALIFADLCRRQLPPDRALAAVAVLCLGTPFFLEWSITARGGFAETLFFSALLLWLAQAPDPAQRSPFARVSAFGIAAGISLWTSEMILPLLPFAGAWLALGVPAERRLRVLAVGLGALAIGLLPLAAYNATHEWQHLRESTLAGFLAPGGAALSVAQMLASAHFVLGWGGWLLAGGAIVGAARIGLRPRPITLAHVLLAHALVYGLAYWLAGLRFLEVPASRVLYPLHLNLAVLLACALGRSRPISRGLSTAAIVLWVAATSFAVIQWGVGREPRATGSWRASWCLVDGTGLRSALIGRQIDVAFVNYWTATPLALANRVAARRDPDAARVVPSTRLPDHARAGQRAAVVLHEGSPLLTRIERSLQRRGTPYERWRRGPYTILSDADATQLSARALRVPALLEEGTRPPAPSSPDGFN